MSETQKRQDALDFMYEATTQLGEAWRGDWADFDGRTLRAQLEDIRHTATEISEGSLPVQEALPRFQARTDLCPLGHGHWTRWCSHHDG